MRKYGALFLPLGISIVAKPSRSAGIPNLESGILTGRDADFFFSTRVEEPASRMWRLFLFGFFGYAKEASFRTQVQPRTFYSRRQTSPSASLLKQLGWFFSFPKLLRRGQEGGRSYG